MFVFFLTAPAFAAGTFVSTQVVANATEVKASRTLTVNALPANAESFTIGSCIVGFVAVPFLTLDELNCADNIALIDRNKNPSDINRNPNEIASAIDSLTNVSDAAHGALSVSGGTGTTTVFTTAGAETSATNINFVDATTGDVTATTTVTGVVPVAQVVEYIPLTPAPGETFRAIIAGNNYNHVVPVAGTVQQVVEALEPLMEAETNTTCTENDVKITCTANVAGVPFTHSAAVLTISLTLQKAVTNDNGGLANDMAWTLSATGPTPISGTEGNASVTNVVVAPGTYTLSETGGPAGYTPSVWVCTRTNGADVPVVNNQVTIPPPNGNGLITCVITNNDIPATLTLVKVVNGTNPPHPNTAWTLNAAGTTPLSGTTGVTGPVSAGAYTLTETGPTTHYVASAWVCPNGNLTGNVLTLANGQNITCTITNTHTPPAPNQFVVTIKKYVDGVVATTGTFPMHAIWTAANLNGGIQASGAYTLASPTYTATTSLMNAGADYSTYETFGGNDVGATCADGKPYALVGYTTGTNEAAAALGIPALLPIPAFTNIQENKYVIVWNKKCTTGIKVIKKVVGGTATSANFLIHVKNNVPAEVAGSPQPGSSTGTTYTLPAGTYTVSETGGPVGYTATYSGACNGTPNVTVVNGTIAICTITNTYKYKITVLKYLDGVLATEGTFPMTETGGGAYTLGTPNWMHMTLVDAGGSYWTKEDLSGAEIGKSCEEEESYKLVGYTKGNTLEKAEGKDPSSGRAGFKNLKHDKYIIVWNETCEECDWDRIEELKQEIKDRKWQYKQDVKAWKKKWHWRGRWKNHLDELQAIQEKYEEDIEELEDELEEEKEKCDDDHGWGGYGDDEEDEDDRGGHGGGWGNW